MGAAFPKMGSEVFLFIGKPMHPLEGEEPEHSHGASLPRHHDDARELRTRLKKTAARRSDQPAS